MATEDSQRASGPEWPCVVNLPASRETPGGVGGRFADSWRHARLVWREHPSLIRSLLLWSTLAAGIGAAVTVLLAQGTTPGRAAAGAGIQCIWMAWWAFFVALHVGLVRQDEGPRRTHIGLPNGLSVLRILLIPTLGWVVLAHPRLVDHGVLVTTLIFLHGFSDVVDGWLARLMRWQTLLGRNLDHGADVLIASGLALAEYLAGLLPGWLLFLFLLRYLGAASMGIYGLATRPDVRIAPSWIGRLSTLVAGLSLFLIIAQPLVASSWAGRMFYIHWIAGIFIVINIVALTGMALADRAFERRPGPPEPPKRLDRGK